MSNLKLEEGSVVAITIIIIIIIIIFFFFLLLLTSSSYPRMASESTKLLNSASSQDFDVLEKTEWELNTFEDTPSYLRSPFILGSYRVHFSLKLCLLSLVKLHNEVLNIHTHFFGCLAFVGTYIYLYVRYLSAMQSWVHFFIISLYVLAVAW
jgi:predicted membrane channel-forming protein YqfA (hemolysin III family)